MKKSCHSLGLSGRLCVGIILLLVAGGCGGDGSDDGSPATTKLSVATEQDMLGDSSIALSEDRNAVLFLQDPDTEEIGRSWSAATLIEKTAAAQKKAALSLAAPGTYQLCQHYPEQMDHRIQMVLEDSNGAALATTTNEGCVEVDIPDVSQNLSLKIAKFADRVYHDVETPAFLTVDEDTINMRFNHCVGCDLNGLDLAGRDLFGTDLTGADLTGLQVSDAVFHHVDVTDSAGPFIDGVVAAVHHDGDLDRVIESRWWHPSVPKVLKDVADDAADAVSDGVHTVKHEAEHVADSIIHFDDNIAVQLVHALDQGVEEDGGELDIDDISFAKSISAYKKDLSDWVDWFLPGDNYHTYVRIDGYNDKSYAWGAFGDNEGGEPLADTTTTCEDGSCIDAHTVAYMMHRLPCRWPTAAYAQAGVCWNLTNRGLYYTGKTVHNVTNYAVIEGLFGTYGGDGSVVRDLLEPGAEIDDYLFSMNQCLTNQRENAPWTGHDFLSDVNRDLGASEVNPRVRLYQDYFQGIENRSLSAGDRQRAYLSDLFELNIRENVAEIDEGTVAQLLEIHGVYLDRFAAIDRSDHATYLDKFNATMLQQMQEYLDLLGDKRYRQLMNLPEDAPISFDIKELI